MDFEDDLAKALEALNKGEVILYPTDTVWGLGCDATNSMAVSKLFVLKHRPDSKAMISLVNSVESLRLWVEGVLSEKALGELMNSHRPTTVVLPNPRGIVSALVGADGSAAFRIPKDNDFTVQLCRRFGKPLVSTSANFSGDSAPRTFSEIKEEIKRASCYICTTGRDRDPGQPSRIVKIEDNGDITIIRE